MSRSAAWSRSLGWALTVMVKVVGALIAPRGSVAVTVTVTVPAEMKVWDTGGSDGPLRLTTDVLGAGTTTSSSPNQRSNRGTHIANAIENIMRLDRE